MRRIFLGLLAIVASATFASASQASHNPRVASNFKATCNFSHSLGDDPIVVPAQPGASHRHDFFGNRTTDAHSTTESLDAGSTTCTVLGITDAGDDDSPYWVPTLNVGGVSVKPLKLTAYYNLNARQPGTLKPWAHGFRMIAGDSKATTAQSLSVVAWGCQGANAAPRTAEPPDCGKEELMLHVVFPDCWDGVSLDSADHKRHVAYSAPDGSGHNVCPASHPVATPGLQIHVTYPITNGLGVSLSSGGIYSGHADFWNTWTDSVLAERIDTCLNAAIRCR